MRAKTPAAHRLPKDAWATARRRSTVDQDITVDFGDATTPNDRVAVIATQPLTDDEIWTTMTHGELLQFHNGEPRQAAIP